MIDYFALALTHGLLAIALLRLVRRGDLGLDSETPAASEGTGAPETRPETRREARARRRRRA